MKLRASARKKLLSPNLAIKKLLSPNRRCYEPLDRKSKRDKKIALANKCRYHIGLNGRWKNREFYTRFNGMGKF